MITIMFCIIGVYPCHSVGSSFDHNPKRGNTKEDNSGINIGETEVSKIIDYISHHSAFIICRPSKIPYIKTVQYAIAMRSDA